MPNTVPSGLLSSATRAMGVLFVRPDGTHYGVTDAVQPFSFDGNGGTYPFPVATVSYQSVQGLDLSNIQKELGLSSDDIEITILLKDDAAFITVSDMLAKFDGSRVIVFEIDYLNPANGAMIVSQYRLSKVTLKDLTIKLSMFGLQSVLKVRNSRAMNPYCDVARFGDKRCDPDQTIRAARSHSATVGFVLNSFIVDFYGDTQTAGYYNFGDAGFTSGAMNGYEGQIKTHTVITPAAYNAGHTYAYGDYVTSGGSTYVSLQDANTGHTPASSPTWWQVVTLSGTVARITWRTPTPYALVAGDTATLCFGCDRRKDTCRSVANTHTASGTNVENFKGWYLPDPDQIKVVGRS